MYAAAVGTDTNYAEAYKWFLLAAANPLPGEGRDNARIALDAIVSNLDPRERAAVKRSVQEWVPTTVENLRYSPVHQPKS